MLKHKIINIVMLNRPGFHFVYPFEKARRMNREFTREIAGQFFPAYFHLLGTNALENLERMEKWFGES